MSNAEASRIFDRQASEYEQHRRRLVPPYDAFYGTALEGLGVAPRPLRRILDLGAGTGVLSKLIAAAWPDAELTLLDGSPAMLAEARKRLGASVTYLVSDLTAPLPAGPWNGIASALAIHHLDDPGKRELYDRIHAALTPGGVFVNAEQVSAPSAFFDRVYGEWQHRSALERGVSAEDWANTLERMRLDRWATVERQLGWLRESGFADADCIFKDHNFAVLVAVRAG